jgi:hypothetical protein
MEKIYQYNLSKLGDKYMVYDSKAILRTKWLQQEEKLLAEGWEFLKLENGVVYLRKPYATCCA